ncbi:MAG: ferritin [Thermoanaerobaculia bacterium]
MREQEERDAMHLSDKLQAALNEQVGNEFAASLQYVALASYFDREDLKELAAFFYRQAEEERDHAMKIVRFVVDADGSVHIPAVAAPKVGFRGAEEAVAHALAGEEKVTTQIYQLVEIANREANYIAVRFLDWFVNEQFEEVSTMSSLLSVVRRAGEGQLLLVEEYLARGGGDPHVGAAETP